MYLIVMRDRSRITIDSRRLATPRMEHVGISPVRQTLRARSTKHGGVFGEESRMGDGELHKDDSVQGPAFVFGCVCVGGGGDISIHTRKIQLFPPNSLL